MLRRPERVDLVVRVPRRLAFSNTAARLQQNENGGEGVVDRLLATL